MDEGPRVKEKGKLGWLPIRRVGIAGPDLLEMQQVISADHTIETDILADLDDREELVRLGEGEGLPELQAVPLS